MKQMEKRYDHKTVEECIYKMWEESGAFTPKAYPSKKPYTIVLPPPNANGILHVGHALMLALEDLLIRWKRMDGYDALWVPGTDHAGFETQVVYERVLEKQGKSRLDYDRATLYKDIYKFVEDQKDLILKQTRALGPSLDWTRFKFTLDDKVIDTVYNTFEKMASEGLIYRDQYIVNYCTHHNTTLSDLELEHEDQLTNLYYVRYPLVDAKENEPKYIVVATTRPEPIFVDTHLAVNPKDAKNKWLVGRKVLNPLTDKEMEIIADHFVDPKFGTGIVKLTPAHDKNDFEVARRHNLPIVPAFDTDGLIDGLSIKDAREKTVEILKQKDLIEKIDSKYKNVISVCYKCKTAIEPIVLPNWFVAVEKLKEPAHQAVKDGRVKIYPKWQEVNYHRWMEEMRDWPISRQIVWGIQFPVWYKADENPELKVTFLHEGNAIAGRLADLLSIYTTEQIEAGLQTLIAPIGSKHVISKTKPGMGYLRETDTFDTWFSSGHWPLICTDYPDGKDFGYFYPTAVLETGWEILRFWVSRMIMFGLYLTDEVPFKDVYLHGLVRAADGRKMSKSLGNQVDPLEMVEEFGADALRMGLISGTANGKDFAFPQDKVVAYRNFANKLWNMARFMLMMFERAGIEKYEDLPEFDNATFADAMASEDKEIVEGLHDLVKSVNKSLEKYRFADASDAIYQFTWHEVADKYIEHVKTRVFENPSEDDDASLLFNKVEDKKIALSTLRYVFMTCLKLLHPFMPFVTEEIWGYLPKKDEKLLISESWPTV